MIFVESALKNRILTAVLCANVHSHGCFELTVYDNCYEIPIKITENTPKEPKGPKIGPDAKNVIEPQ